MLSDLSAQWCQDLLKSSTEINVTTSTRLPPPPVDAVVQNTLFSKALRTEGTVRAWQVLQGKQITAPNLSPELLILLSLGRDLSGHRNTLHGGILGVITDQAAAMCVGYSFGHRCVTKTAKLEFKKGVPLPSVVLCRTAVIEKQGQHIRTKGTLEDGQGTIFGEADILCAMRPEGKL
ncbi:MAG: hypothetical protein Q9219_003671 [cf. Caloplaca sp. 3 TL-2023]